MRARTGVFQVERPEQPGGVSVSLVDAGGQPSLAIHLHLDSLDPRRAAPGGSSNLVLKAGAGATTGHPGDNRLQVVAGDRRVQPESSLGSVDRPEALIISRHVTALIA